MLTVAPRRARCGSCARTQILLPTSLVLRRADSTEVIGNALVAKAQGAGVRTVAARFDRPESTVRRWFRSAGERHGSFVILSRRSRSQTAHCEGAQLSGADAMAWLTTASGSGRLPVTPTRWSSHRVTSCCLHQLDFSGQMTTRCRSFAPRTAPVGTDRSNVTNRPSLLTARASR